MKKNEKSKPFAICLDNSGYEASLIPGKVYRILPDPDGEKDDLIRIIDESGEDYLFDKSDFILVDLPASVEAKLNELAASA